MKNDDSHSSFFYSSFSISFGSAEAFISSQYASVLPKPKFIPHTTPIPSDTLLRDGKYLSDGPQVDEADPDFEDNSGVTPDRKGTPKKQTPGSNAFVPSVAGMIIAAEVVKDLTQFHVTDLFKE